MGNQFFGFGIFRAFLEIRFNSFFQRGGFSDIDNPAIAVFENIAARFIGKVIEF